MHKSIDAFSEMLEIMNQKKNGFRDRYDRATISKSRKHIIAVETTYISFRCDTAMDKKKIGLDRSDQLARTISERNASSVAQPDNTQYMRERNVSVAQLDLDQGDK